MNTVTAVRNRILQLCNERNITINALATISGLLQSSINNIIYGKSFHHSRTLRLARSCRDQCPALFCALLT